MKREYEQLIELIQKAQNTVFFGGAGVSTESGLKDFRGKGGLYTDETTDISPAEILSRNYFFRKPKMFFDYYRKNMLVAGIKPNAAHYALAKLEEIGKLKAVITQNIDGLHQLAGSKNVFELHGTVYGNHCILCDKEFPFSFVADTEDIPYCDECGALIHPDIVLYGEQLPAKAWFGAEDAIMQADLLIISGTSLLVEPAASLVRMYQGGKLVIINKTPTPTDERADILIREPVGQVLGEIIGHFS